MRTCYAHLVCLLVISPLSLGALTVLDSHSFEEAFLEIPPSVLAAGLLPSGWEDHTDGAGTSVHYVESADDVIDGAPVRAPASHWHSMTQRVRNAAERAHFNKPIAWNIGGNYGEDEWAFDRENIDLGTPGLVDLYAFGFNRSDGFSKSLFDLQGSWRFLAANLSWPSQ
ncbi:MAG: hypothetical protein ACP5I4_13440 [Oceanipulchritudo sp.]